MGGWRRGCRGSRPGRGGGGAWGRRRRGWGAMWALEKAHRQDSLCHAIVDQVGIVDQGVKQVKAGILSAPSCTHDQRGGLCGGGELVPGGPENFSFAPEAAGDAGGFVH